MERGPVILTGRPIHYDPGLLLPWLRPIWQATDYACGRRLAALLPEWIPAFEQPERRMPLEVREKLLLASGRTLDRLLSPLRLAGTGRSLTRLGTLLRHAFLPVFTLLLVVAWFGFYLWCLLQLCLHGGGAAAE